MQPLTKLIKYSQSSLNTSISIFTITMILPDEMIIEVLLLLPIATLMRFRCVSKKWRDLIDSPIFVKSHLDRPNKAHSTMIFAGQPNAYQIDLDSVCNYTAPHPHLKLKELMNLCPGNNYRFFSVVGPCNGLLCAASNGGVLIYLWNPSTRKHFHVPQLPFQDEDVLCSWGLGYDCNSNDYKAVGVAQPRISKTAHVVWVYSLKSGSWKRIGYFPYVMFGWSFSCIRKGAFVNGALHWIVSPKRIAAFDIGRLEYHLVPEPESMQNELEMEMCIGVLDGCLYAVYQRSSKAFDSLWVMKEYGVQESWIKLIGHPSYKMRLTPLAYNEVGDLLLWSTRGPSRQAVMRYEFETGSFNRIEPFDEEFNHLLPNLHRPLIYIPSLVHPDQSAGNSGAAL